MLARKGHDQTWVIEGGNPGLERLGYVCGGFPGKVHGSLEIEEVGVTGKGGARMSPTGVFLLAS